MHPWMFWLVCKRCHIRHQRLVPLRAGRVFVGHAPFGQVPKYCLGVKCSECGHTRVAIGRF